MCTCQKVHTVHVCTGETGWYAANFKNIFTLLLFFKILSCLVWYWFKTIHHFNQPNHHFSSRRNTEYQTSSIPSTTNSTRKKKTTPPTVTMAANWLTFEKIELLTRSTFRRVQCTHKHTVLLCLQLVWQQDYFFAEALTLHRTSVVQFDDHLPTRTYRHHLHPRK